MLYSLLFPPKCTLCRKLLSKNETDLCHSCRDTAPEIHRTKSNIQFIAHWTALWYYKDDVRKSIQRFKFSNARSYAEVYARHLAVKVMNSGFCEELNVIAWVPVSFLRRFSRGYDQSQLIAVALGKELGLPTQRLLRKIRNTCPQSQLRDASARRANIQSAYRATDPSAIADKRILLIDDVVTTGSTASECARILLTAGAKEVCLATVAATPKDK